MITALTTTLTQRALDHRRTAPRFVRWTARWHAPTRRMLEELGAVDAALHDSATETLRNEIDLNPRGVGPGERGLLLASHPDPGWWRRGGAALAWSAAAAVVLLSAAAGWFAWTSGANAVDAGRMVENDPEPGSEGAGHGNPANDAALAHNDPANDAQNPDGAPTADPAPAPTLLSGWSGWPAAVQSVDWPTAPTLNLAVAVDEAAVAQRVQRLGSELERPLRQEWARLVRDVAGVVDSVSAVFPDPATPEPAAGQSRHHRPGPASA